MKFVLKFGTICNLWNRHNFLGVFQVREGEHLT